MILSSLKQLWSRSQPQPKAKQLYAAILAHARQSWPYTDYGVPDTLDGRFDMILLVAAPVLRTLKQAGWTALADDLVTHMFDDFDIALRQMGVGDLGMKRRMRALAEAYKGRMQAYGSLLNQDLNNTQHQAALQQVLCRNLYRQQQPHPQSVAAMAQALHRFAKDLEKQTHFIHNLVLPPFTP